MDNTLSNVKHEIRSSPAKVDAYIEAAVEVGDDPVMPASYCASRWLDRYKACSDVVQHLDTLEKYYKDAKLPRQTVESRDTSPDNSSSNSESEESNLDKQLREAKKEKAKFKKNPRARVEYMKEKFSPEK